MAPKFLQMTNFHFHILPALQIILVEVDWVTSSPLYFCSKVMWRDW